ncbi:MAG: ferrous iron transporter A [Candidatus Dasytiphilus stammeri]
MQLVPHQNYQIVGFSPKINIFYRHRLLTLGMLPGSIFKIIRIAPLGDPIQIETRHLTILLRKKDLLTYFQLEMMK